MDLDGKLFSTIIMNLKDLLAVGLKKQHDQVGNIVVGGLNLLVEFHVDNMSKEMNRYFNEND